MAEDYTASPVLWLVFSLAVIIVAGIVLLLASRLIGGSKWHEVDATILSASVTPIVGSGKGQQKDPDIGSGYRLDVRYEYSVNGRQYESTRVVRGMPAAIYPTEPRANRALEEYVEESRVSAYSDPDNPANAVLISSKKIPRSAWFALYLLTSLILAVFGIMALSHFGVIDLRSHFEELLGGRGATHISPDD